MLSDTDDELVYLIYKYLLTTIIRSVFFWQEGPERRMFVGLFSRLTDSCLTSMGRSANTPADAQTHPWGTATRARCDKAQGLFADLAGGLPFPGHRLEVKETLPEERPLTTLLWESLVKGLCRQNNTSLLPHENSHGDFSELTKKINRTCLFSSTLCFILYDFIWPEAGLLLLFI